MTPISRSKHRLLAIVALALIAFVPAVASATDPTPDPAEPTLIGIALAGYDAVLPYAPR